MLKPNYKALYEKQGFLHLKDLFDKSELLALTSKSLPERKGDMDLTCYKELYNVIINPNLLSALSEIFGSKLTYMGDSGFLVNMKTSLKGAKLVHRDNQKNYDPRIPIPVVRCGLYLNDYTFASGSLKVGVGSHKTEQVTIRNILRLTQVGCNLLMKFSVLKAGDYQQTVHKLRLSQLKWTRFKNISTQSGDLVFWNLRTLHQGYSKKLRLFPKLTLPAFWENILPNSFFYAGPKSRDAIFFVILAEGDGVEEYISSRFSQISKNHWDYKPIPEVIERIEASGLHFDLRGFDQS